MNHGCQRRRDKSRMCAGHRYHSAMTRFVVLPGLDGDAASRAVFLDHLRLIGPTEFVTYPLDRVERYADAQSLVEPSLPKNDDFILIAESFSGPVACSIAGNRPAGLRGLVLVASFARYPWSWLRPLVNVVRVLPSGPALDSVLRMFLVGKHATPEQLEVLRSRVRQLPPATIRARLRAVLSTDTLPTLVNARIPTLLLQATNDRLVPNSAAQLIVDRLPATAIHRIEGPHALMQMAPDECARHIRAFVARTKSQNG